MRDISNLITAVTLESALASAALQALAASEQHLQDAQDQILALKQQAATNSLDPDQVTTLLDTISTTTAQLSAAIPANTVATATAATTAASSVASGPATAVGAGSGVAVQARDAAATAAPVVDAAAPAAPGAFAQPTETATAGLAAGPGATVPVQP